MAKINQCVGGFTVHTVYFTDPNSFLQQPVIQALHRVTQSYMESMCIKPNMYNKYMQDYTKNMY